ncbi:hypothetical protein [Gilvimarinus polysaccharolyticus]|uniref:hypothetical protein n=1 Tax=Gilvimarinus polysaccharolyticus TaxID=863921 RepID=UPI0006730D32|nr:hypothetical protein [Gilvimarinus polysaccharolyticus]
MVRSAREWPWSSYRATAGQTAGARALTTDWVLGNFGRRRKAAMEGYKRFVQEGKNQSSPWEELKNQVYLGSDEFVDDAQAKMNPDQSLLDIPKPQKLSPPRPLEYYVDLYSDRKEGMSAAYRSGHYTLSGVGDAFGVSYATVSRAVKSFD